MRFLLSGSPHSPLSPSGGRPCSLFPVTRAAIQPRLTPCLVHARGRNKQDGDTALSSAASAGSQVCAEILLVHGANVNHVNNVRSGSWVWTIGALPQHVHGLR